MLRLLVFLLCLCAISIAALEGNSMSLIAGEKVCVASGFDGKLTLSGKPAAGARIVRTFNWKDEKGETEETIADKDGRFSLPTHWDVLKHILPTQFVSHQSIFVHFEGKRYQIWGMGKMDKSEYSEFGGKPTNFRCELNDDIRRVDLDHEFVGTNCYWECTE